MDPSRIRIRGPLVPYVEGLWRELAAQGYSPLSIANVARLMAHLSRWLLREGLTAAELNAEEIGRFLRHRRRAGYTSHLSNQGLKPILGYLDTRSAVPPLEAPGPVPTALDTELVHYRDYLLQERAVSSGTARFYEQVARDFLGSRAGRRPLRPTDIFTFVLRESRTCSIGFVKYKVTALRSWLRYRHLHGDMAIDLAAVVPPVAGWRLTSLPKALRSDEVKQLLEHCDRRSHVGRRAFAALLLMVRLGLRAGEVAALQLEDVDWTRGELLIRGKGHQRDRLPLPADVGAALADYARWSRPPGNSRQLLLRVRAPYGALNTGTVAAIVHATCLRAGLPVMGAHRLRHTAATELLRHGASLSDIAQVLRHRHIDTTAIYAKVDRVSLRELAQPWPGGEA